jgi:hypothetical protein
MGSEHKRENHLMQYLLWAMTTAPARFRMLSDFIAWASDLGFGPDECRVVWNDLRSIFRQLYGEPVYEEMRQAA